MVTAPPSGSIGYNGMSFVPHDLVPVQIGWYTATVYPKVDSAMPVHERAHAFQVARSTFELLPINARLVLDALGMHLNCSAIIEGLTFV
jgi:hypothetical protein